MSDLSDVVERLSRMRAFLCPNHKFPDEVERCPCRRGGRDVGDANGYETGCKDLHDAIEKLTEAT